jgi:hypothetical protein
MRNAECGIQDAGYRNSEFGVRNAEYRMQDAGCRIPDAGYLKIGILFVE